MYKKPLAIALIIFIILVQLDLKKQEAKAVAPAILAISYIATALVAAGAVGTVLYDEATDTYSGSLWESAKATYEAMGTQLKTDLENALLAAKIGYVTMNTVAGLWDFIHGRIAAQETIVPVYATFNPSAIFSPNVWTSLHISTYNSTTHIFTGMVGVYKNYEANTDSATLLFSLYLRGTYEVISQEQYLYTVTEYKTPPIIYGSAYVDWGPEMMAAFQHYVLTNYVSLANNWDHDGMYDVIPFHMGEGTGTYPQVAEQTIPGTISDGDASRKITIPSTPTALNNATTTTPVVNNIGVTTTAEPDANAQNVGAAAAAAAAAAYAAAIAAGYTPAEAAAAAAAASAAIVSGLSAEEAAAAGAAAAVSAAAEAASGLTTDIAHSRPGDLLDFSKLKYAANLFTDKFPFSLPWDLKNMLTSFGSGSIAAPTIPFALGNLTGEIDLSRFNSLAAGVRVLELIIFTCGLLFGTRKLIGGDS